MKRLFFAVLILLFLCGCSNDNTDYSMPDSIKCTVVVKYKDISFKALMNRDLPHIYQFKLLSEEYYGTVVNINSDSFNITVDDSVFEEGTLPKSSFFYCFITVLDNLNNKYKISKIDTDFIEISGSVDYFDFSIKYDYKNQRPVFLSVDEEQLFVEFYY